MGELSLNEAAVPLLFYFPVKIAETFCFKEFLNGDFQAIADLFDGGNGGAVVSPAYYIVQCGLGYSADVRQAVYSNLFLLTQFLYAEPGCLTDVHFYLSLNLFYKIILPILS